MKFHFLISKKIHRFFFFYFPQLIPINNKTDLTKIQQISTFLNQPGPLQLVFPISTPPELIKLINSCVEKDYNKRPCISEVYQRLETLKSSFRKSTSNPSFGIPGQQPPPIPAFSPQTSHGCFGPASTFYQPGFPPQIPDFPPQMPGFSPQQSPEYSSPPVPDFPHQQQFSSPLRAPPPVPDFPPQQKQGYPPQSTGIPLKQSAGYPPNFAQQQQFSSPFGAPPPIPNDMYGQNYGQYGPGGNSGGAPFGQFSNPGTPPIPRLARARADYTATNPDEISFAAGEYFQVLCSLDQYWSDGISKGKRGRFPTSFVEFI